MRVTTASEGGTQGYLVGYGSKAYRNYVLFALTLILLMSSSFGPTIPPTYSSLP